MAEAKTDQDPSIEEILESIRQIISDDGETPAVKDETTIAAKATDDAPSDLDLSQKKAPADKPGNIEKPAETNESAGKILDLTEKVEEEVDHTRVDMSYDPDPPLDIMLEDTPLTDDEPLDDDSLLSETTADAATAAMAKLLASNVAVERDEPVRVGRVTLEDIARDLMRPLIKTWLDQNLPRVIEKVVAKEMEKLARRARDED
ncbi:MAG TPA: DUF2497 domain-containing protein [Alphaproteobacteria bacterium]|nr:DUF2497 domain-containing protein [Alphaproteobacteria bacterium]